MLDVNIYTIPYYQGQTSINKPFDTGVSNDTVNAVHRQSLGNILGTEMACGSLIAHTLYVASFPALRKQKKLVHIASSHISKIPGEKGNGQLLRPLYV